MKKEIMISVLVATIALGTVGCGSDGTSKKVKDPIVKKKDPVDNTPKFDKRENGRLTVSKELKTGDFIIDLKHKSGVTQDGTIFQIDKNNDGVFDYQIVDFNDPSVTSSGFYEYNSSSPSGFSGPKTGRNPFFTYTSGVTKDSVKLHNLLTDDYFTVNAYDVNSTWDRVSDKKLLAYDIVLAKGNKQTFLGSNGLSMDIESNATNITIKLKGKKFTKFTKVYIDVEPSTTESNTTNYLTSTLWKNLEAKYKIENGELKTYEVAYEWGSAKVLPYIVKDNSISLDLKIADIGNPDSMIVGIGEFANESAYDTNITIPAKNINYDIPAYTF